MLVEFKVSNFRSIRDEQVLSLAASKEDKNLEENNVVYGEKEHIPNTLRAASIYGANASGKSNLIKALACMRRYIEISIYPNAIETIPTLCPFVFEEETLKKPITFDISFVLEKVLYRYKFSLTREQVFEESLFVNDGIFSGNLFERTLNALTNQYAYQYTHLDGPTEVWEKLTRPNALYLSTAVQYNSSILNKVFEWFTKKLVIFNENMPINLRFSPIYISREENREKMNQFMRAADPYIKDIKSKKQREENGETMTANNIPENNINTELNKWNFFYDSQSSVKSLDFSNMSTGTKHLFFIGGPIIHILEDKEITLVIDELEKGLHPHLVEKIVRQFQQKEVNKNNAQLIFTTHSASLLSVKDLFRRDQIWFTSKNSNKATELVSLVKFDVSKETSNDVEKNYLQGMYGGIPYIEDLIKWK